MSSIWSLLIGLTLLLLQIRVFVASRRSARERGVQWMKEIEAGDRGQQTRDSAILDLERALATCPHASLLRKLGVIAPLLGVTLTALAFMANTGAVAALLDGTDSALDSATMGRSRFVEQAIAPLFMGVLLGAVLAILNQILLAILARQEDAEVAAASSPALLSRFRDPDSAFERFSEGVRNSTSQLREAADLLHQMMRESAERFSELSTGSRALASELNSGAANLREAVETPAQEFAAAAAEMRDAAQAVATKMKSGFVTLGERSQKLQQLLESIAAAHEAEVAKFGAASQGIGLTLEGLRTAADQIRLAMSAVAGSIDRLEGRSASALTDHLERLRVATDQFVTAVENSSRASTQQATASESLNTALDRSVETMRQATVSLQEAARPWWRRRERGA